MTPQEELAALRRLAHLEAKASGMSLTVQPQDNSAQPYVTPEGGVISAEGQEVYKPVPLPPPTEGMSGFEQFAAGAKSKLVDYGMGAQQLIPGMPDISADVAEKKRLDAPLMNTGAGQAGAVTGALLPMLATAGFPVTNTYRGATALGGAMGLLEPTTEGMGEKLGNAAMGVGAGFAGQLGGNVLAAMLRGGKALISPLFESGRSELADYIIQQQAADPLKALASGQAYRAATPGVVPTLAEATLDPGISGLQRGVVGPDIAVRENANRTAIVDALKSVAQNPTARQAAVDARAAAADPLYAAAKAKVVPVDAEFEALLQRPAVRSAAGQVEINSANAGAPAQLGADVSGDYLHQLKMALDGELSTGPQRGIDAATLGGVKNARQSVLDWIEDPSRIPEYGQARQTYSSMSRPIGQMDIGQELVDKLVPALSQAGGSNARLSAASLAKALRDAPDNLARKATGFEGATLENILDPSQISLVEGAVKDLGREQAGYDAAMIRGSPTSRNLITQNLIDQLGGSLGGPRTQALVSALAHYPLRAIDLFTAPLSQEVNAKIAQKLADSSLGLQSLQYQPRATANNQIAEILRKATPIGALGVYSGQQ